MAGYNKCDDKPIYFGRGSDGQWGGSEVGAARAPLEEPGFGVGSGSSPAGRVNAADTSCPRELSWQQTAPKAVETWPLRASLPQFPPFIGLGWQKVADKEDDLRQGREICLPAGLRRGAFPKYTLFTSNIERVKYLLQHMKLPHAE